MTNQEFYTTFNSEEKCLNYLKSFFETSFTHCPKCKHDKLNWKQKYKGWRCSKCCTMTSLKSITFMRDSNKTFIEWLEIIYIMCQTKKAISIAEIHRQSIQTHYETVYHMVQKVRAEMGCINLKLKFHFQTKINGLKAVLNHKIKFLELYIQKREGLGYDYVHLKLPKTRVCKINRKNKQKSINYPYPKLISIALNKVYPITREKLIIHNKHKKWLRILAENIQKQLRGIFHFCSDQHIQGILNEYTFKYNLRNCQDHKFHYFFEKSFKT